MVYVYSNVVNMIMFLPKEAIAPKSQKPGHNNRAWDSGGGDKFPKVL
jgi:hypothetical protein